MLNIGSMCTGAKVHAVKSDLAKLQLTSPVCTREGEKVALSRRVEKHWRLIGANSQILPAHPPLHKHCEGATLLTKRKTM